VSKIRFTAKSERGGEEEQCGTSDAATGTSCRVTRRSTPQLRSHTLSAFLSSSARLFPLITNDDVNGGARWAWCGLPGQEEVSIVLELCISILICDQFPAPPVNFLHQLFKVIDASIENPKDPTPLRPFLSFQGDARSARRQLQSRTRADGSGKHFIEFSERRAYVSPLRR
jgi:hypothetical protein